jgi:hypothetical protein
MDDQEYTQFFISSVLDKKDFFTSYSVFSYVDNRTAQTRYFRMTTDANHNRFPTYNGVMSISKPQVWDELAKKSRKDVHHTEVSSIKLVHRYATDKMSQLFLYLTDAPRYDHPRLRTYESRFGWSRFSQDCASSTDISNPNTADICTYHDTLCFRQYATKEFMLRSTPEDQINNKAFNNLCGKRWDALPNRESKRTEAAHEQVQFYKDLREGWHPKWRDLANIMREIDKLPAKEYRKIWKYIREDYARAEGVLSVYERDVRLKVK